MSAMSHSVRNKMFEFFKALLGRRAAPPQYAPGDENQNVEDTGDSSADNDPSAMTGLHQNSKGVELPLQVILNNLPLELQTRVKQPEVGELTLAVPLEKILAQLSRGSVKVSFGELRQAAPQVFTPANDRDRVLVPLPLGEIISRLNPALITRRRVQKQLEVPADINGPFDATGKGLIFSVP